MEMFGDACFHDYYDGNIKEYCKKGVTDYRYAYKKKLRIKSDWLKNDIYVITNEFNDYQKKFKEIEEYLVENGLEKVFSPQFNFVSENAQKEIDQCIDQKKNRPDVGKTDGYWAQYNWGQDYNKYFFKLSKGIYGYNDSFALKKSDFKLNEVELKKGSKSIIDEKEHIYRLEFNLDFLDSITEIYTGSIKSEKLIYGGNLYLMLNNKELGVSAGAKLYL